MLVVNLGIYPNLLYQDTSEIFGLNMTTIRVMGCGLKLGFESRVMQICWI